MFASIRSSVFVALLALPIWAQRTQLKPDFNIFTVAQDIELGRRAAQEIEADTKVVSNVVVNDYLNSLGRTLIAAAPESKQFQFQFRILDERRINAFGLPGGIVEVNRGTLESAVNESQLASVLAHEIAHVVLRHGSHQLSKAYTLQSSVSRLGAIGKTSISEALAKTRSSFSAGSTLLKNPKDAEDEADILGVQILYDAGYDSNAATAFLEITAAKTNAPSRPVNHPETAKRIARIQKEISKLAPRKDIITDSDKFQSAKALLLSLP